MGKFKPYLFVIFTFLAACTTTTTDPTESDAPRAQQPQIEYVRSFAQGKADYARIIDQMRPVIAQTCGQFDTNAPKNFCNFKFKILEDDTQPPNAFQSMDARGNPVITFNSNLLRFVKNDAEIAYIIGHEAGHQIARHLVQKRGNAIAGSIIGGIIFGSIGLDTSLGTDVGSAFGGRAYSQKFELQADVIGTHIAARAGYDPRVGAKIFERLGAESVSFLSTHPASPDRIRIVNETYAQIQSGDTRIRW